VCATIRGTEPRRSGAPGLGGRRPLHDEVLRRKEHEVVADVSGLSPSVVEFDRTEDIYQALGFAAMCQEEVAYLPDQNAPE
jgi:hypothetical protein